MVKLIEKENITELKSFALMMMWAFPLFFSVIIPWLFNFAYALWPLVISALFAVLYVVSPQQIYYIYRFWMFIAGILGWINTRIILGGTFFLMIMPFGFIMRRRGKLHYKRPQKGQCTSHYIKREDKMDKNRLENPF
ncbi:SxtJ family membrane protein [Algibacillus agarilyticus]|uniref:SxtJ family membrane protein n=1 Tax=Algibacillus agarilyticus TaxID=2234133 RepID=UPI000DD07CE7|nr:SxtJ family membrane protein [Algibacillus agarilyticus]